MVTDGPGDVITGRRGGGMQAGMGGEEKRREGVGGWQGEKVRVGEHSGGKGGRRERSNAPNHNNFSSPQLHC